MAVMESVTELAFISMLWWSVFGKGLYTFICCCIQNVFLQKKQSVLIETYSLSYNLTPPISRVLIGQHMVFCSLTSPKCCTSPRKCMPVNYKRRQKAGFPIVTWTTSKYSCLGITLNIWKRVNSSARLLQRNSFLLQTFKVGYLILKQIINRNIGFYFPVVFVFCKIDIFLLSSLLNRTLLVEPVIIGSVGLLDNRSVGR